MAHQLEPGTVLDALKVLTSPDGPENSQLTGGAECVEGLRFDCLLKDNIRKLQDLLSKDEKYKSLHHALDAVHHILGTGEDTVDVRWSYVLWNLRLLLLLEQSATRAAAEFHKRNSESKEQKGGQQVPALSPDVFSFGQQKTVSSSLQFVVLLGMCPSYLPGVGLPVQKRSQYGALVHLSTDAAVSLAERMRRLLTCLQVLLQCARSSSLSTLVISKHLLDLLAGLLQLANAPLKPVGGNKPSADGGPPQEVNPAKRLLSEIEKEWCQAEAARLVHEVYPPLVVQALLLLQGGPRGDGINSDKRLRAAPKWLVRVCGRLLSQVLLKKNGVQAVLQGMLEQSTDGSNTADWRKCDAAAEIIANCPSHMVLADYYSKIAPQVLQLYSHPDKLVAAQFQRVASSTVAAMARKEPVLTQKLVFQPLLQPLAVLCQGCSTATPPSATIVAEQSLTETMELLHKIYVSSSVPQLQQLQFLLPVTMVIFNIFIFTQQGVSHLRGMTEDLLLQLLKHSDLNLALEVLVCLSYNSSSDKAGMRGVREDAELVAGDAGGVAVIACQGKSDEDVILDYPTRCTAVVDILQRVNNLDLSSKFFIYVLQKMTSLLKLERKDAETEQQSSALLLNIEENQASKRSEVKDALVTFDLITKITETCGEACMRSVPHMVQFVEATIRRGLVTLTSGDPDLAGTFENETLSLAMGLLGTVLIAGEELSLADKESLKTLLPTLHELAEKHPEERIRNIAKDLQVAIATHGLVQSEAVKYASEYLKRTENKAQEKPENTKDAKIKESETVEKTRQAAESIRDLNVNDNSTATCSYDKALQEVKDPLVFIQGHGLIAFKRLIEENDEKSLNNAEKLLHIFKACLSHEDTYVYLSAIQALAALAKMKPDSVLPVLAREYANFDAATSEGGKVPRSAESRIKLGEVLVKLCRELGESFAPHYKGALLPAFLCGTRDRDSLVRASSLSNLGELCKLLGFSLGGVVHELVACCSSLVKSDPAVEVRQAAAMLVTLLLQGLDKDAVKVLEDVLGQLYRLLKDVRLTEKEEGVLVHVHLALEELDRIMRNFLFPKQTLQKQIHILDPP